MPVNGEGEGAVLTALQLLPVPYLVITYAEAPSIKVPFGVQDFAMAVHRMLIMMEKKLKKQEICKEPT